jgi:hypothetical protein
VTVFIIAGSVALFVATVLVALGLCRMAALGDETTERALRDEYRSEGTE